MNPQALCASLLMGLALAFPAAAKEDRLALVEQNETFMSVVDIDEVRGLSGERRQAASITLLRHTASGVYEGVSFDVVSTLGEYDCTTPRKWRSIGVRTYALAGGLRMVAQEGGSDWTTSQPTAPPEAIWKAVCQGELDSSGVVFPRGTSVQEVLEGYRRVWAND